MMYLTIQVTFMTAGPEVWISQTGLNKTDCFYVWTLLCNLKFATSDIVIIYYKYMFHDNNIITI